MKNFLFTILGGILALIVFVLGSLFGEFVNVIKGSQSSQSSQISSSELVINEQISASIEATPDIYISYPSFYAKNISNKSVLYGSLSIVTFGMLWLFVCISILFYGSVVNLLIERRKK